MGGSWVVVACCCGKGIPEVGGRLCHPAPGCLQVNRIRVVVWRSRQAHFVDTLITTTKNHYS